VANAVENILAAPPEPDVEPDYRHKEDYGRVPEYLEEVKMEMEDERQMARAHIEEAEMMRAAGEPMMRELSAEEREELLGALKAKWDVVNARYQKMTHQKISTHNSSLGQIRNKEQCERQMDELEKDIARLSVKGPIFVVDE
jgi:ribosomal protein L29